MKKSLLLLLCTAFLIASLFSEEIATPTSKTSTASAGIFSTDVDNFMSVHGFSEINDSFLFLSLENSDPQVGYGKVFNFGYLGFYYDGYMVDHNGALKTEVVTDPILDSDFNRLGEIVTTTTTYSDGSDTTDEGNTGSILFGLGTLGIQLAFKQETAQEDYEYNSIFFYSTDKEYSECQYDADGNLIYKTYDSNDGENFSGSLKPALTVGTVIETDSLTIKPKLNVSFDFFRSNGTGSEKAYKTSLGTGNTVEGIDDIIAYDSRATEWNSNRNILDAIVASDIELKNGITVGVSYGLNKPFYSNTYTGTGGSEKTVNGTAQSYSETQYDFTTDGVTAVSETYDYNYTEFSQIMHNIDLSVSTSKDLSERFTVGGKLKVGTEIYSRDRKYVSGYQILLTSTDNNDSTSTNNYTNETTYESAATVNENSYLMITPVLNLGMQYELIPSKLTLNAGVVYSLPQYTNKTTTSYIEGHSTTYIENTNSDGTVDTTYSAAGVEGTRTGTETKELNWDAFEYSVSAGMSFALTESAVLDLLMANVGGSMPNTIYASAFTAQIVFSK